MNKLAQTIDNPAYTDPGLMSRIMPALRNRMSSVGGAGNKLMEWYKSQPDHVRYGLAGALLGGGLTGTMAALSPKDPEEHRPVVGPALLGALLGGGVGAGLPLGLKFLTGAKKFEEEPKKTFNERLFGPPASLVRKNLGATVGTGIGLRTAWNQWPALSEKWITARNMPLPGRFGGLRRFGASLKPGKGGGIGAVAAPVAGAALGHIIDRVIAGR